MKNLAAAIVAAVMMSACTTVPSKPSACQVAPQWIVNDPAGNPTAGVYVCFGSRGDLLYVTRPLTSEQLAALTPAPAPVPKPAYAAARKKASASKMADPCADMTGAEYTACRIDQHAAKAPGEGLKAVK